MRTDSPLQQAAAGRVEAVPAGGNRESLAPVAPLSVVVPVHNEAAAILPLAREVVAALRGLTAFELIFVDDASTDGTAGALALARAAIPELRHIRHTRRGGQSAALATGLRAARGEWVATLDGDGQNDPADLPRLLEALRLGLQRDPSLRLVMGHRVTRRDSWLRRLSSRVANGVRARALGDATPDTGCGIKLLHRPTWLLLPFFDHQHRFLPALFQREGASVVSVPVAHRPRETGTSKYGLHDRLWVGIVDLAGVAWLRRRFRPGITAVED